MVIFPPYFGVAPSPPPANFSFPAAQHVAGDARMRDYIIPWSGRGHTRKKKLQLRRASNTSLRAPTFLDGRTLYSYALWSPHLRS